MMRNRTKRIVVALVILSALVTHPRFLAQAATSGAPFSVSGSGAIRGDFNGDGKADLAIGVPFENLEAGSKIDAGAVNVVYGSTGAGLTTVANQFWHQDSPGIQDGAASEDTFGSALATGDFDGDGHSDLAVGSPFDNAGVLQTVARAGQVNVLYGSPDRLTASRDQLWGQGTLGIKGAPEFEDAFGHALAAGDFNGDGKDDLAIGVPGEDINGTIDAGAVNVIYGSTGGLSANNDQIWDQDIFGSSVEPDDQFGFFLTAGDFNGDGKDDLAISAHGEDFGVFPDPIFNAGLVHILYGSSSGLSSVGNQTWSQNSITGIEGTAETGDSFGLMMAAGDFNDDGDEDLAVGVGRDNVVLANGVEVTDAGAVNVIFGSPSGLTSDGSQYWHQGLLNTGEVAEVGDNFGATLAAGDFDGDSNTDLAIGVPNEDLAQHGVVNTIENAGAVNVIYQQALPVNGNHIGLGLSAAGAQLFHQNSQGISGAAQPGDTFGAFLAANNYDGEDGDDLAIGVTGDTIGGQTVAGAVNVIYSSTNGLLPNNDPVFHQNVSTIDDQSEQNDSFGLMLK